MKYRLLTIFFLLLSVVAQSQTLLKKQVSLTGGPATVEEWLSRLSSASGIAISYSSEAIDLSLVVRAGGHEKTVEDYLKTILRSQKVRYVEQHGKIVLVPEAPVKKKFTVSGYVTDKSSGERLPGASVYIGAGYTGTTSNAYGFYSITLEAGPAELYATYTGYTPYASRLELQNDLSLDVALDRQSAVEQQVVISTAGSQAGSAPSRHSISGQLIKSVPALMAEGDVLKSLQLLPGVQAGNEGSSGLNVRGGSADQNLILLDGVPVYNASHAFGLFSIFNPDAVHNVEILKSGFPASYGGRLSSVVDVHMKEGDKNRFRGEGGIGLVFSSLTLEGPLKKGRSSFMLSGRRTYADLILGPLFKSNPTSVKVLPFFSDINAKVNFPAGPKDHIYISLYMGKDQLKVEESFELFTGPAGVVDGLNNYKAGFSWGNITSMARWNHQFGKRTFSNFTFTHGRYRFNTNQYETRFTPDNKVFSLSKQDYFSGIQDWGLKADLDYRPAPDHFVKTGFSAILHRYQPGISYFYRKDSVVREDIRVDNSTLWSGEYDVYAEDDIRLSPNMKLNAGIRASLFAVKGKLFPAFQPRVSWLYRLNERWSLKASYSGMNQFIHLLTNSNLGLPTDLWLPVTRRVPPQTSRQLAGGAYFRPAGSIEVSVEVYYKSLRNVIDYSEGRSFGNAYDSWEDLVQVGKGKAYGVEWMLQKKRGKLTGMMSYTLGRTVRRFAQINEGRSFPYKYDRRHEAKAVAIWQPKAGFEISGSWILSSGIAITMPVAYYFDPNSSQFIDIYEGRNNARMPAYHRMDVSMKFSKKKKWFTRTWVLSIYNVYNRFNPFFRYKEYDAANKVYYSEVAVFPFMPSFGYQFKF
ncbi:MAG TPA: TonB-dependent receptor [Flavisolibacter sp.]|nr:TonB-dependent receptor [Flavisolibacter sp.]